MTGPLISTPANADAVFIVFPPKMGDWGLGAGECTRSSFLPQSPVPSPKPLSSPR
jgi:hypothetical protein